MQNKHTPSSSRLLTNGSSVFFGIRFKSRLLYQDEASTLWSNARSALPVLVLMEVSRNWEAMNSGEGWPSDVYGECPVIWSGEKGQQWMERWMACRGSDRAQASDATEADSDRG